MLIEWLARPGFFGNSQLVPGRHPITRWVQVDGDVIGEFELAGDRPALVVADKVWSKDGQPAPTTATVHQYVN